MLIYDDYLAGLDRAVILSNLRFYIRILRTLAFEPVINSAAFTLKKYSSVVHIFTFKELLK